MFSRCENVTFLVKFLTLSPRCPSRPGNPFAPLSPLILVAIPGNPCILELEKKRIA